MIEGFSLKEILAVTGGKISPSPPLSQLNTPISGISTDSRTLKPGELFVPLTGESFNGHNFIAQALEKGAAFALSSKVMEGLPFSAQIILVADPLLALHQLAGFYRRKFNLTAIGVTGSCGKTTTKDIIAGLLAINYRVLKTPGNFNNEIGVPLTLLELQKEHQVLVCELAMRARGEIKQLAELIQPEIGVITNIGETHLGILKSRQEILEAKCELLEVLPPTGLAVLNADSPFLSEMSSRTKAKILSFATQNPADIQLLAYQSLNWEGAKIQLKIRDKTADFKVPFLGQEILSDLLAAIGVALFLGLSPEKIQEAFSLIQLTPMRMEKKITHDGIYLINDAYNASPISMQNALRVVKELKVPGKKLAVLGDMLELGERAFSAHQEMGELAARSDLFALICVGELGEILKEAAQKAGLQKVYHFKSKNGVAEFLKSELTPDDLILFKASRALGFEAIIAEIWGE